MLKKQAEKNYDDKIIYKRHTALHIACKKCWRPIVQYLIEKGAYLEAKDIDKQTHNVKYLVSKGANQSFKRRCWNTIQWIPKAQQKKETRRRWWNIMKNLNSFIISQMLVSLAFQFIRVFLFILYCFYFQIRIMRNLFWITFTNEVKYLKN